MAILVRAIYQTREFEERFLKVGLGYRVLGGTKFYERAEVKDAVAYLRIINQKYDDLALERVIGSPRRGIGESTLNQLYNFASQNKLCLEDSIKKKLETESLKPKIKTSLIQLTKMIDKWRLDSNKNKHYDLLKIVLDESGYSEMLKNKKDIENENRLENIKELLRAMHDYDNLQAFLEHVALATSIDKEWEGDKINLMTMHGAKGLEFDVVFLPGWEEGPVSSSKIFRGKRRFSSRRREKTCLCWCNKSQKRGIFIFCNEKIISW